MVSAKIANYFSPSSTELPITEHGEGHAISSIVEPGREETVMGAQTTDIEAARPPYVHAMLAGGFGGLTGDMLMHSLDTVKTRQQGDPHMPPKYTTMGRTYYTIWRQEGIRRGLYGGVTPAFLGSFSGTVIFFGTYEWSKRMMVDSGVPPWVSYLAAGFVADLAASPLYVPSEVLKTRLQLQGRYNNPFFKSGYNYRSTWNAARVIARTEGVSALFHGFQATLWRDLPYSALQFAFYEQEQKLARSWAGSKDIGLPLEVFTGASAGGMAGVITCPLDVVKTRLQTQLDPDLKSVHSTLESGSHRSVAPASTETAHRTIAPQQAVQKTVQRAIATSSPSTTLKEHSAVTLDTSSTVEGLKIIYKSEGFAGWFRGVGPRAVWTSVQSGTMLVLYQMFLKWFDAHPLVSVDDV
ncbi:MAG: hypothetical protein M1820_005140 [Bogoriella megaspora]|nr:MAG: hypothetical protein M1820_005140 [Bogoriella megaspora]